MPKMREALMSIRSLLTNPDCWTHFDRGRSVFGAHCNPRDPMCTSWCILGAMDKVCDTDLELYHEIEASLRLRIGGLSLSYWNDCVARHTDVMRVLDEAIREAHP